MLRETWHTGRGFAADYGWCLEQLTYGALSSLYSERDITRQFTSQNLRCHIDMVLLHNDILYAFFVTTGKEQNAPTRNSQYPTWEEFDELKEVKTSDVIGEKSIAINIIFGNKKYWASWLLSAKEALFDSVFYPQYDRRGNFFPIEDELKHLSNEWKKKSPEKPFYKYIQHSINNKNCNYPNIKKVYQNLCDYFLTIDKVENSLKDFWKSVKNTYKTNYFYKAQCFLRYQLTKYGVPNLRPSLRHAIILSAVLKDIEKQILQAIISSHECTLTDLTKKTSYPTVEIEDALEFLISLNLIKKTRLKNGTFKYELRKKEVVSSLNVNLTKLGIDKKLIIDVINSLLKDRKKELVDNFIVMREWEKYKNKVSDLLSNGFKSKLRVFWNLPDMDQRRIWRKIILDIFGLKESDIRPIISTTRMEVEFYTRDFSEYELNKLSEVLEEKRKSLYEDTSIRSLFPTLRRKIGERVWQELNNPKVNPIEYLIRFIVQSSNQKQNRIGTFFKKLIKIREKVLQTYPEHSENLSSNQGIVSYPWCIKRGRRIILLKSRFADKSTVQHRCPEEAGRAFGVLFNVESAKTGIQVKFNEEYVVFFVPDGYWRETDLEYLARNGIFIFLNFNDLKEYIQNPELLFE